MKEVTIEVLPWRDHKKPEVSNQFKPGVSDHTQPEVSITVLSHGVSNHKKPEVSGNLKPWVSNHKKPWVYNHKSQSSNPSHDNGKYP